MSEIPESLIEIFNEALTLAPWERAAYLEKTCRGDESGLRERVESLLVAHERAGDFLGQAVTVVQGSAGSPPPVGERPGDRIGKYLLIEQIGEGGCGVVFLAEQKEPVRRQVALKVLKPGMDTRSVIAQFESERQALAMMDHPHIARVFDAGATEVGRPYFVMEWVRGVKITDYCDRHRLTVRERLELFVQVCHAIQHAHQKGIMHRDIKPSNILVAANGEGGYLPKVIDFGIAKATTGLELTDKTYFTAFEMLIGTPAYMSPEQAALTRTDLDTRTDIYSLGVLLYELLAGAPPLDVRELFKLGLDEVRRGILTRDPVRPSVRLKSMTAAELADVATSRQAEPSKLIRSIHGDLDWIVMKAIEKDRSRRYDTANALAVDVQHHLSHEPVSARPPGTLYQAGKLVARNRLMVGSLSAIFLLLATGLAATSILLTRERAAHAQAEIEKRTARVEAAKSKQVGDFLGKMLSSVSPSVAMGRDTTLLRELLAQTDEGIDSELGNQPEVEAALRMVLAKSYQEIGDLPTAERMVRRALQLYQAAPSVDRRQVALAMTSLGNLLVRESRNEEAGPLLISSANVWRELGAEEEEGSLTNMENLAVLHSRQGRSAEGEALIRRVYEWRQKHPEPGRPQTVETLSNLAVILYGEEKFPEAEQMFRQVLEARQRLLGLNHPDLALILHNLSATLSAQGKNEEARAFLSQAVEVYRKSFHPAHPGRLRETLDLADMNREARAFKEAEPLYREFIANDTGPARGDNSAVEAALGGLVLTLQELNRSAEAEALLNERLALDPLHSERSVPLLEMRMEFLARCGRWKDAAKDAGRLIELKPDQHQYYHALAPLLAATGDDESYRKLCHEIVSRFAETKDGYTADRMAKDCLIRPGAVQDLAAVDRMADFALKGGGNDVSFPLFKVCKALSEFRQGNFSAADEIAKSVGESLPDAEAESLAVRTMALQRMGREEEARKLLEACKATFQARLPKLESGALDGHWRDWIIAQELLKEACSMLEES